MRNKIYGIFLMCLFGICMSVNAQGTPEIYNRDEKVILNHELFYYKEQYYFHIDDLEQLGFTVTLEDKKCTVTAEDCLGEDRKLVINKMMTLWSITAGDLYPLEGLLSLDEKSVSVNEVSCDGTYKKRSTKEIGDFADIILLPSDSFSFSGDKQILIKVGGEYYISSKYIGENMSHKYSLQDGRLDLFISDKNSVITDTTVNLKNGTVAKAGGWNVDIYTAYKTGDGDSLDDFEILSSTTCTVPENESSVKCFIETPAEKIESNNIYYIADFGNRYNFVCSEYDFSKVGTVLVYGEQKDIMYTMRVTLPEIDEADVPFTVYVVADKNTYSKEGIVKAGEISSIVEITGLPVTNKYSARIEFDYHKYKNAYIQDIFYINTSFACDFETDFNAEYSRVVVCDISLPDDFITTDNIEVKVEVSKYVPEGSVFVADELTDWNDSKIITLNNDKRSEQICLYSQSSSSKLSYEILSDTNELCQNGYLDKGGKIVSNNKSLKEITDDVSVDMQLLRKKTISVDVLRPFSLSTDNDIFATIELNDASTSNSKDIIMDFTEIPLIASGERKSRFEFEVAEDQLYTLEIEGITGDEKLFDYYCYVKSTESPADRSKMQKISFSDDAFSLMLLQCNNIVGTIKCDKMDLEFSVLTTCNLHSGETLMLLTEAINGEFSFKIPEDTDTYTIDTQTIIGKKSYYVSDGVSTNNENEATELLFDYDNDRTIIIEYILQNPLHPIEISTKSQYDFFVFENISDYLIEEYDVYIAYYDKYEKLICVNKTEKSKLESGQYVKISIDMSNQQAKRIKAFAWKKDSITPMGNVSEISYCESGR